MRASSFADIGISFGVLGLAALPEPSPLDVFLDLEGDRMATLRIDKDTFANERDVVKEERRMRIDNQPYGRLNEIIYDQAFTVHPYKHATIGSMEDLEAASVDDVREFYRMYYVPSNATLAIVGDFEPAQAIALVTQYLGRVPRAEHDVPRDIAPEPVVVLEVSVLDDEQAANRLTATKAPRILLYIRIYLCQT